MPTTTVGEAEGTYVNGARAVEDRLADCENGILLLETPHHVHRDTSLREKRVDHEPIAGVDHFLITKVEDHQVVMHFGATNDLLPKLRLVVEVEIDPLLNVGQRKHLINGQIPAAVDEGHHQFVV